MQLTGYIVAMHGMYPHNITDIFTLHVAHLLLFSSLFTLGLCLPKGSLQYFTTIVQKILNTINQWLAIVSKHPKNYALRLLRFYYRFTSFTYVP